MGAQARDNDTAAFANIECEQALLGAILLNGEAFDRVDGLITAEDLTEPVHAHLFTQFERARKDGRAINVQLATAALGSVAAEMLVDGLTVGKYVSRLAEYATSVVLAPDYAKTIRDCADRRRMREIAETVAAALTSDASTSEIATLGIEGLDAIALAQPGKRSCVSWFGDAAFRSVERMQWGLQNPGKLTGVSWGLADLDAKTNGLQRGELIILAGRPGMGKSGLMVSCARQTAKAGSNALLFSLEMGDVSLADRALADECADYGEPPAYQDIARGSLTYGQAERVAIAASELKRLPIRIDETPALSVAQIAARSRKHKQRLERDGKTLDLLFVDHMHLVRASDRYAGNRVSEITEISGGLKALAKELHVPVVALAQLSRNVESRDDKRPMMSDLRDSGAIEQDADVIVFVFREEYYLERAKFDDPHKDGARVARLMEVANSLEAIVAKQRNGPTGTVNLYFDAARNAARCLDRRAAA